MKTLAIGVALAIGAVVAFCLALLTWHDEQPPFSSNTLGSLQSVLLTNNQVYYGRLERTDRHSITLTHVFYVQVVVEEKTGARTNKLVERATTDWHGPFQMRIPVDKIIYIESVGPNSQVAKLIREAESNH